MSVAVSWSYGAVGLLALVTVQALTITDPPTDSVGYSDSNINMTCTTDGLAEEGPNAIEWYEFPGISETGLRIMAMPGYPPDTNKFTMLEPEYNLQIKDLTWQKGGRYNCKLFYENSPHEAHLFVFDGEHSMSFSRTKQDQKQNLTCQARFGASKLHLDEDPQNIPTMEMTVAGISLSVTTILTVLTSSSPYIFSGWAEYVARSSDDGAPFICTVRLNSPNTGVSYSIPADVEYVITDAPILAPRIDRYIVGDQINCTGKGNPTPQYTWYSLESPVGEWVRVTGSILLITDAMIGEGVPEGGPPNNRWRCEAYNSVEGANGNETATIDFSVDYEPGNEPSTAGVEAWKIAVGICVPLAVIGIVVAVVLVVVMKKKRKARDATDAKSPYGPPPEVTGEENRGGVFPADVDIANGKPGVPGRTPINQMPDPLDNPVNRSKDSPGYADLGIKHIHGSYPGVNVSVNSSMDSFDESASHIQPPNLEPNPNRNYQPTNNVPRSQPQPNPGRPNYSNIPPNHPDTFV